MTKSSHVAVESVWNRLHLISLLLNTIKTLVQLRRTTKCPPPSLLSGRAATPLYSLASQPIIRYWWPRGKIWQSSMFINLGSDPGISTFTEHWLGDGSSSDSSLPIPPKKYSEAADSAAIARWGLKRKRGIFSRLHEPLLSSVGRE